MSVPEKDWQRCEIQQDDQLPVLHTDVNLVEQALLNILLNAIQASSAEQKIFIKISGRKNRIWVQINDNGGGIASENLADVYKPFFSTKEKGTGLGLAITKRLIEHLRGTVEIQSEPNKGTRVTITIPDLSNVKDI